MRTIAYLAGALATLLTLNACDLRRDGGNVPSIPTAPTAPLSPTVPSPAVPQGEITVRSITPASPATLIVRECTYLNGYKEMCSSQFQMAVDVQFENEVSNAVISAAFYTGSKLCGIASSSPQPLAAVGRTTFSVAGISFSDDYTRLLCSLPVLTTRMVVQLWEVGRPAVPLLTQEFVNTYTFGEP